MYDDKLIMAFQPNTNILSVESGATKPFIGQIKLGVSQEILDKNGDVHIYVTMTKKGDDFIFNVNGLDKDDQPDDYDIYDLLNNQDLRILDKDGKNTGRLNSF